MNKVFLGGTCNGSKWRDELIPMLTIDYFNPVVEDWDTEAQQREGFEKQNCDYHLYIVTPEMTGVFSIAEVVDDSNKMPDSTVFCILDDYDGHTFNGGARHSLGAVALMLERNGVSVFKSLDSVARYLNAKIEKPIDKNAWIGETEGLTNDT